jgi:hypothetical protein
LANVDLVEERKRLAAISERAGRHLDEQAVSDELRLLAERVLVDSDEAVVLEDLRYFE